MGEEEGAEPALTPSTPAVVQSRHPAREQEPFVAEKSSGAFGDRMNIR
jgi:hypothetical protein